MKKKLSGMVMLIVFMSFPGYMFSQGFSPATSVGNFDGRSAAGVDFQDIEADLKSSNTRQAVKKLSDHVRDIRTSWRGKFFRLLSFISQYKLEHELLEELRGKANSNNIDDLSDYGIMLIQLSQPKEKIQDVYERILKLNPNDVDANIILAGNFIDSKPQIAKQMLEAIFPNSNDRVDPLWKIRTFYFTSPSANIESAARGVKLAEILFGIPQFVNVPLVDVKIYEALKFFASLQLAGMVDKSDVWYNKEQTEIFKKTFSKSQVETYIKAVCNFCSAASKISNTDLPFNALWDISKYFKIDPSIIYAVAVRRCCNSVEDSTNFRPYERVEMTPAAFVLKYSREHNTQKELAETLASLAVGDNVQAMLAKTFLDLLAAEGLSGNDYYAKIETLLASNDGSNRFTPFIRNYFIASTLIYAGHGDAKQQSSLPVLLCTLKNLREVNLTGFASVRLSGLILYCGRNLKSDELLQFLSSVNDALFSREMLDTLCEKSEQSDDMRLRFGDSPKDFALQSHLAIMCDVVTAFYKENENHRVVMSFITTSRYLVAAEQLTHILSSGLLYGAKPLIMNSPLMADVEDFCCYNTLMMNVLDSSHYDIMSRLVGLLLDIKQRNFGQRLWLAYLTGDSDAAKKIVVDYAARIKKLSPTRRWRIYNIIGPVLMNCSTNAIGDVLRGDVSWLKQDYAEMVRLRIITPFADKTQNFNKTMNRNEVLRHVIFVDEDFFNRVLEEYAKTDIERMKNRDEGPTGLRTFGRSPSQSWQQNVELQKTAILVQMLENYRRRDAFLFRAILQTLQQTRRSGTRNDAREINTALHERFNWYYNVNVYCHYGKLQKNTEQYLKVSRLIISRIQQLIGGPDNGAMIDIPYWTVGVFEISDIFDKSLVDWLELQSADDKTFAAADFLYYFSLRQPDNKYRDGYYKRLLEKLDGNTFASYWKFTLAEYALSNDFNLKYPGQLDVAKKYMQIYSAMSPDEREGRYVPDMLFYYAGLFSPTPENMAVAGQFVADYCKRQDMQSPQKPFDAKSICIAELAMFAGNTELAKQIVCKEGTMAKAFENLSTYLWLAKYPEMRGILLEQLEKRKWMLPAEYQYLRYRLLTKIDIDSFDELLNAAPADKRSAIQYEYLCKIARHCETAELRKYVFAKLDGLFDSIATDKSLNDKQKMEILAVGVGVNLELSKRILKYMRQLPVDATLDNEKIDFGLRAELVAAIAYDVRKTLTAEKKNDTNVIEEVTLIANLKNNKLCEVGFEILTSQTIDTAFCYQADTGKFLAVGEIILPKIEMAKRYARNFRQSMYVRYMVEKQQAKAVDAIRPNLKYADGVAAIEHNNGWIAAIIAGYIKTNPAYTNISSAEWRKIIANIFNNCGLAEKAAGAEMELAGKCFGYGMKSLAGEIYGGNYDSLLKQFSEKQTPKMFDQLYAWHMRNMMNPPQKPTPEFDKFMDIAAGTLLGNKALTDKILSYYLYRGQYRKIASLLDVYAGKPDYPHIVDELAYCISDAMPYYFSGDSTQDLLALCEKIEPLTKDDRSINCVRGVMILNYFLMNQDAKAQALIAKQKNSMDDRSGRLANTITRFIIDYKRQNPDISDKALAKSISKAVTQYDFYKSWRTTCKKSSLQIIANSLADDSELNGVVQILAGNEAGFDTALEKFSKSPDYGQLEILKKLAKTPQEKEKLMLAAIPAAATDENIFWEVGYYFALAARSDKLLEVANSLKKSPKPLPGMVAKLAEDIYLCVYYLDRDKWKQLDVKSLQQAIEVMLSMRPEKVSHKSNGYYYYIYCSEILMFIYALDGHIDEAKTLAANTPTLQSYDITILQNGLFRLAAAYLNANTSLSDDELIKRMECGLNLLAGRYPAQFADSDLCFTTGLRLNVEFDGWKRPELEQRMCNIGGRMAKDHYSIMLEKLKSNPTANNFREIHSYLFHDFQNKARAIEFIDKCAGMAPDDIEFQLAISGAYASYCDSQKQSLEHSRKCLQKWPDEIRFISCMGDRLVQMNEPLAAAEAVEKSVDAYKGVDTKKKRCLWRLAGEFNTKAGRYDKAMEYYKKIVGLNKLESPYFDVWSDEDVNRKIAEVKNLAEKHSTK